MTKSIPPSHDVAADRIKGYHRRKLALAGQLRLLRNAAKQAGDESNDRLCAELMIKLAEDRFTLAVLGQFKRGKSSLINAIIGRELLPTGVLPITSAITIVKFGPRDRLLIEREELQWPEDVPLAQLADYVTEHGNPGNRKKIKTATVEVPVPFLRPGLEFADTPGVGSAIVANTATTQAFLPHCDAVLFVTSIETPLTAGELAFLREIRQHVHKIFFVVNKIDLLAEPDQREVLQFIARTLREQMHTDDLRIFPLSCNRALAGQHDSGVPALQEELSRFLSVEKTATFLAAIARRMARLRKSVGITQSRAFTPPPQPAELAGMMQTRGCPICDYLYRIVFDFLSQWQYAIATDKQSQNAFADELGFCPLHTWQLTMLSSPVGASVGYTKVVQRVARLLRQKPDVSELVSHTRHCRVCRLMRDAEKEFTGRLAASLAEPAFRKNYELSQGACLRHLALLITVSADEKIAHFLRTEAARRFEEAGEDMQSFAMKTDALRRYLRNKNEEDAFLRAITHLAGSRGVCAPWPDDIDF